MNKEYEFLDQIPVSYGSVMTFQNWRQRYCILCCVHGVLIYDRAAETFTPVMVP